MSNALKIATALGQGINYDPSFSSVSLLLHGDGTNGSTTFTDSSSSPKTMTAVGNAQISTSIKQFGTGSMSFDGTGDYLTTPNTAALQLGSGNFTIEAWFYRGAYVNGGIVGKGPSPPAVGWQFRVTGGIPTNGTLVFQFGDGSVDTLISVSGLSISTLSWYHVAVVREGTGTNQTKIYLDGVQVGTGTCAVDFNETSTMYIGAGRGGTPNFNGYIDDLRITKGVARYTANFTPPTAAFPDA